MTWFYTLPLIQTHSSCLCPFKWNTGTAHILPTCWGSRLTRAVYPQSCTVPPTVPRMCRNTFTPSEVHRTAVIRVVLSLSHNCFFRHWQTAQNFFMVVFYWTYSFRLMLIYQLTLFRFDYCMSQGSNCNFTQHTLV